MSSAILTAIEGAFFIFMVLAYFYVATNPETSKALKLKEIAIMYGLTFFYAFSKRISALLFLMSALAIVIFKILNTKDRDGRQTKGHIG